MKRFIKRLIATLLVTAIALSICVAFATESGEKEVTILFTHDLHSHLLPSLDEAGNEYGGYARLMTIINEQKKKYPDAVLVDGGDFAMGSLFQTAFATSAIELRMMGAMGYDATTFGNHEYDYLPSGLAKMLNVASKYEVHKIVMENYLPPTESDKGYDATVSEAFNNYGVKDYTLIERDGVVFAVFGIFGVDADECAPNSGMIFEDPVKTAEDVIKKATAESLEKYKIEPVMICLSHSGTEDGQGEDYDLASQVDGIDVIVSGHTHTTLNEPIVVNNTYIVSAGEYGKYLGVVNLDYNIDGTTKLKGYELIAVDENVKEDEQIATLVEEYKTTVENDYLSKYNVTFDEVLVNNPYNFENVDEIKDSQHESTVCNLFADAYKWAVEKETGETVDVALTAAGVIRESLPFGDITVSDVFNSASLGVGTEGELIAVYITGKDLKNAFEVDASIQPIMNSAQLYFSGAEYSFNTKRMIFNKVDYMRLKKNNGTLEKIDNDKLYKVVTGMYCGQMLGAVESKSFGLLAITPRDKDGNPLSADELVNYVVYDKEGNPVKEWYAIASYLQNMNGIVDKAYEKPDGRKTVYSSINPINLVKNPNKFTIIVIVVILVLILIITLIIRAIIRKSRKRNK